MAALFQHRSQAREVRRFPWKEAVSGLALVGVFSGIMVFLPTPARQASDRRWTATRESVAAAGAPIINAVTHYQAEHGAPPPSIAELSPRYLPAGSSPGAAAAGDWVYEAHGSEWSLRVGIRRGYGPNGSASGFGDAMVYRSDQRYKRDAFRGVLTRYGGWGYYVEHNRIGGVSIAR